MFKNTIQIVEHFMVRVANDLKTQGTQMPFALPVFCYLRPFGMNVTINFNHKQLFRTKKVGNEGTNCMLPTKFE